MKTDGSERKSNVGAHVVRLVGLWILAGALFKLLLGTPADLPAVLREVPIGLALLYKLAIAGELVIASLALLKPRWGWPLVIALLLVFTGVLIAAIARGEESCGCFGSKVTLTPTAMLAIDDTLLVLLLLSRPWSRIRGRGLHPLPLLAVLAGAAAAPWLFDRNMKIERPDRGSLTVDNGTLPTDGSTTPRTGPSTGDPTASAPDESSGGLSKFVILEPETWVGDFILDTPLGALLPGVEGFPMDATWVLWRQTCEHCAEHLEHLAQTSTGEPLVLVQLPEKHDSAENNIVHIKPQGGHVFEGALPATVEYVITTPADMRLEAGVVVEAREGIEVGDH